MMKKKKLKICPKVQRRRKRAATRQDEDEEI